MRADLSIATRSSARHIGDERGAGRRRAPENLIANAPKPGAVWGDQRELIFEAAQCVRAFEPDHLTAVSTLVVETRDTRRGMWLGAISAHEQGHIYVK